MLDFAGQQADVAETVEDRVIMLRALTNNAIKIIIVACGAAALLVIALAYAVSRMPPMGFGILAISTLGTAGATAAYRLRTLLRSPRADPVTASTDPNSGTAEDQDPPLGR